MLSDRIRPISPMNTLERLMRIHLSVKSASRRCGLARHCGWMTGNPEGERETPTSPAEKPIRQIYALILREVALFGRLKQAEFAHTFIPACHTHQCQLFVCYAAEAGALYQPDVFRERPALRFIRRHFPGRFSRFPFLFGKFSRHGIVFGVDRDAVSIAD